MKKMISLSLLLFVMVLFAACKETTDQSDQTPASTQTQTEESATKTNDTSDSSLDYIKGRPLTDEEIQEQKSHEPSSFGYRDDSMPIPAPETSSAPETSK